MERRSFLQSAAVVGVGAVACTPDSATGPSIQSPAGSLLVTSDGEIVARPGPGKRFIVVLDQNAPTNITVENPNPGTGCQAEFRVKNGVGAGDLFIAGMGYNDGSNFLPNEVGVIAESTSAGLHLRANADTYIRMSVGLGPVEIARVTRSGLILRNVPEPPSASPSAGGILYSEGGALKWRGASGTVTTLAT